MRRLLALAMLVATNAAAQCVMCQRTAAAQGVARARVLDAGILIMALPTFAILGGVLILAYKRRGSA